MKQSQPAQFKRTNIKVIKTQSQSQGPKVHSNGSSVAPTQKAKESGSSAHPRVINVSMFKAAAEHDSSSLGPPADRTPVNHPSGSFKSMSQEPKTVRSITNKRQLTFGGVKKVINTVANHETTFAPDQIVGLAPSTTTTTGKHKLYLPKKNSGAPAAPSGIQLQDGHRRRLQALAAAQHGGHSAALGSSESRDPSYSAVTQQKSGPASNSTSGTNRMKVISKKLITLSTKKVNERNAAANVARTENNIGNVVCHLNMDSKSVSATRPQALNLNFNAATNIGAQPSAAISATTTNQNHHHGSALSRFNANPAMATVKKQGNSSVMQTRSQKANSGHASVADHAQDAPGAPMHGSLTNSVVQNPLHGSINIRQEVSPNRTAYNSQPAGGRKYAQMHHNGGGLGYRRHQIIQDITDETSPNKGNINFSASAGRKRQNQLVKQSSESSMKSLKQITQALNKQSDLKKVFYAKISQSPSTKSINTIQSCQSSGGPPSSQPSQQVFTLTQKANLISQENSAATSRERTLNFKLKKHGEHGQLQNHKEKRQKNVIQIQPQQIHHNQQSNPVAAVNKRRPLVIRKNNFVLTKKGGSNESSLESNNRGNDAAAAAIMAMPLGNTINQNGIKRVMIQPLNKVSIQPGIATNKLNQTLHSNNSGNRALNNTQKIGRAGQGNHYGVNSNESLGSEASLTQNRNQLGNTLRAVNASIKKAQILQIQDPTDSALFKSADVNPISYIPRKSSEPSLEKLTRVNTNSSPQQIKDGRLIKVNRSKKKLDTARRSRIQQLKDITHLDSGPMSHPLAQSISRGIPQLGRNHSNEIIKKHPPNGKQILQVQTDFNATLPISLHKPAGSITIKADYRKKGTLQHQKDESTQNAASAEQLANSAGELNVSSFPSHPARNTGVRNSKNNGLRPVRLFNYATTQAQAASQMAQVPVNKSMQRDKADVDKWKAASGGSSNFKDGKPTPTSTKSQKSLRRGQIFRKQTRRNSQANDEQQSYASKENTSNGIGHEILTTPTDAQNVSSTCLPLKPRRSNNLGSQRQLDSEKNQQSSYFQSSSGDKVGYGTSKPVSDATNTNQSGIEDACRTAKNYQSMGSKPFLNARKQVLKQFDSEGQLTKPGQQQHSANELGMKNDHSELIVTKKYNLTDAQNSAEQILPSDKCEDIIRGSRVIDENSVTENDPMLGEVPVQSNRRSLERVESIKNLHSERDFEQSSDKKQVQLTFGKGHGDLGLENTNGRYAKVVKETEPVFNNKNLILAPQASGKTSDYPEHQIYLDDKEIGEDDVKISSPDAPEEDQPGEERRVKSNQEEELRIEHNDTLPPPGPSAFSVNQNSGQVKKVSAAGTQFGATKVSDMNRELMTQTADTSNRKTISNQRAYCNSSDSRVNVIGTAFSFKSQTSPETVQEIPQFPMTPQQALLYFSNQLTDYEKKEILDYPEIYFIGAPTAQKVQGSPQLEHNFGFDDDKGDYKIITNDHIGFRFEIKSFLGKGSFGTAIKCWDHKTGVDIALKVIKNKKKYYYQAGVELKILQFLKQNDPEDIMNVIHLNDYVVFRKHLCIGFELMSMNLFEFLKINDFNGFDHNLIRRFAIQLLYALKYLKMFQIIHCDLKPENILLKESNKSGIKIIDFGSSTFIDERVYTYIQSRFYRAPEIMLGIPYDTAIDMWSFGCIMAELYIGYPIFPGDSENDQMSRLMEMVGVPDRDVLAESSRKDKFFTKTSDGQILDPIMCKNSRGKYRKPMGKPLALVIGDEDPDFTDFVEKCLCWNPKERLSPDEALKHVWILKGLPPQVLIHHQKMHNISTPELPARVLDIRNEFLEEQQKAQQAQEMAEMEQMQEHQRKVAAQTMSSAAKSSSQERAGGKIRLKRQSAQVAGPQNKIQQQAGVYSSNQAGLPPVLPPAQVILNQPSGNLPQSQNYPGSTKSSQKAKSLGQSGKLTFKIQQNNSNAAKQPQQVVRAQQTAGIHQQQHTAEAAQQQSIIMAKKQFNNLNKTANQ